MDEPTPVLQARGLTRSYHMGEVEVHAARGADLDLFDREFVVILGPSGSGKSTLLNLLGGLDVPTSGTLRYRGRDLLWNEADLDANLELPGFDEPITARFVSIPTNGRPAMNRFHVRSGRSIAEGGGAEVVVSEGFAKAHRIVPGDGFAAIIQGRQQHFRVVGIALSPEYVIQIRPGDVMPEEKHFGVFWASRNVLAAATDMEGSFNDISARLTPDASEKQVLASMDRLLERYGGLGAFSRADHVSDRFLTDEIRQLKSTAVVVPSIFLSVAAFLLHVIMARMVGAQREQIATLKALGYSNLATGMHFARMVLLIVLTGLALGVAGACGWPAQ